VWYVVGRKDSSVKAGVQKEKNQNPGLKGNLRRTVGSRNPYAFAEHVLGVTIDWQKSSPQGIQRLLEKMNEKPFYTAFDDIHASIPEKKPGKRSGAGTQKKTGRKQS
jgi:hypothetical protein